MLGEEMCPQIYGQEVVEQEFKLTVRETVWLWSAKFSPNLGGPAGKNKDKTPLVVVSEDFHLSLLIYLNASGLQPQLSNARLFQVITFLNNDQKSLAMFNVILQRDNYQGIESGE